MKKIVMGLAALTCAAAMFAADVSSKVQMKVDAVRKAGDDVEFIALNSNNQKDADALIFAVNGDKAGAQWQVWYKYDGTNGENVYNDVGGLYGDPNKAKELHGLRIRSVNVWFKPVDSVKVTVGDTSLDSYKEMIFWWHGVYGAKPGSWGAFGGEYLGGSGVKVEYSPIAGLDLAAALLAGVDSPFISTVKDFDIKNYAVKAKYAIAPANMSVAAVYADKGTQKLAAIGFDYGSPWSGSFYAFANFNFNLNDDGLAGFSVDNFEKYTKDALQVTAHLPFVMYKDGDAMKAGMYATVKATYALGGYTPYLLVTNEPDGDAGWLFDDFKFNLTVQPGVTFNVGSCGVEAAFRLDIADGKLSNWKLPVTMTVAF